MWWELEYGKKRGSFVSVLSRKKKDLLDGQHLSASNGRAKGGHINDVSVYERNMMKSILTESAESFWKKANKNLRIKVELFYYFFNLRWIYDERMSAVTKNYKCFHTWWYTGIRFDS